MDSKESMKNTNGLQGNTRLNWEKEKKLLAKCMRESRLINRQEQKK